MISNSPEKIRVLLVNDHGASGKAALQKLQQARLASVEEVLSLRHAEQKLEALLGNGKLLAVVLPSRLKESSGACAAGLLRRNSDLVGVPLLVFTEDDLSAQWSEIFQMGADDVLTAEQPAEEVRARILKAIGLRMELAEGREREQDLAASNERLSVLASIDELTGLHNARYFNAALDSQWQWSTDTGEFLSLLLLDIDRFKNVNDTYTHLAGNEVLEAVAGRIRHSIRQSSDLASRYGGEEFGIILPGAPASQALRIAEGLRSKIEQSPIKSQEAGTTIDITVSVGVICAQAGLIPDLREAEDVLREADKALYQAKKDGRNCVRLSPLSKGLQELRKKGTIPVDPANPRQVVPLHQFLAQGKLAS